MSNDPEMVTMKARILNHMTTDHAESLVLYQRYYNKIPLRMIGKSTMDDIQLDHMIVNSKAGRTYIPIDPPMKSFAESRTRLVEMHKQSLTGLGLSEIPVKEYILPNRLWQWVLLSLCIWIYISSNPLVDLKPPSPLSSSNGSFFYRVWSFNNKFSPLAKLTYFFQPYVFYFMVLVHIGEAGYFMVPRLYKHQVPTGSKIWWLWTIDASLQGVGAISRFDVLVAEKEAAAEGKKKQGKN